MYTLKSNQFLLECRQAKFMVEEDLDSKKLNFVWKSGAAVSAMSEHLKNIFNKYVQYFSDYKM